MDYFKMNLNECVFDENVNEENVMKNIKSSHNYIWNTSSVLGKGATGDVFAGLHKHTAHSVAVKSFKLCSYLRPFEVQKREFEVLKKVNHKNIVKLLAIEEENETHNKVLIMELCLGGSLLDILNDPINFYGLQQNEFLLVLKHLAEGMKYLRDMNIIHRDLKPGNIMKFVSEDGNSIYKLTDFGSARELEDDQQFMSFYGTEEYLHPFMYKNVFLCESVENTFKGNVDLWSIGVTLFQIATGVLPFRPYCGPNERQTMFKIITEKASGVISGTQQTQNGEIDWTTTLPKTCLLSSSIQPFVTQLLSGLLESDANKMWSFDKFFESVSHLLSLKIVHIFYANTLTLFHIYSHPTEKINEIKIQIENTFKLSLNCQLIIWNKQIITDQTMVKEIETTLESPLLLFNTESTQIKASIPENEFIFPEMSNTTTDCDSDAKLAKVCASVAYSVGRSVEKVLLHIRLAKSTPFHVMSLIEGNVNLLSEKQRLCSHLINSIEHELNYLIEMNKTLNELITKFSINTHLSTEEESVKMFDKILHDWSELSLQMTDKVKHLKDLWTKNSSNDNILSAQSKAKVICSKIRENWQTFNQYKQSGVLSLSSYEQHLHQLEKIRLNSNCKKLSDLLNNELNPAIDSISGKLEDWYSGAEVAIIQSEYLLNTISTSFMTDFENLRNSIKKVKEDQRIILNEVKQSHEMNELIECNPYQTHNKTNKMVADIHSKLHPIVVKEFESVRETTREVWAAVEENKSLITEFESLLIGTEN